MILRCHLTDDKSSSWRARELIDKLWEANDAARDLETEVKMEFLARVPDDMEMAIQAMNRDKFLREAIELRPYLKRPVN